MRQSKRLEGVGVDGRGAHRRWSRGRHRKPVPYSLRLIAIFLIVVGLVAGGTVLCVRIAKPYQRQAIQEKQISQLSAQLASVNSSNDEIQRKIDALHTQEGIETAARSQRFVVPGEVLLNVEATPIAQEPVVDQSFGARIKRAWDGLTGH
jgi:cell division protein FtsB